MATTGGKSKIFAVETVEKFDPPTDGFKLDIERIRNSFKSAQTRNGELQKSFELGSAAWHACETIDDHIDNGLAALGE